MSIGLVYGRFDLLCVITMLMITVRTIFLRNKLFHQNMYLRLMAFAMLLVVSDMLYEYTIAGMINMPESWLYLWNSLYFVASVMIGYTWFVYTQVITGMKLIENISVRMVLLTPAVFTCAAALISYWTKWVFYFDEAREYHRGPGNWLVIVVPTVYFLAAVAIALGLFIRKRTRKTGKNLKTVLSFAIFPIASVAIQIVYVGLPVVCVGSMLGMMWVFINIITNEREILTAENMVADAKSQFFASMSHEIRTPINAVLGMNTMIMRESSESQIVSYAKVIENSGKMLLSTVNDILDFSKAESGKLQLVCIEYATADMIRDLMQMIKVRADDRGLKLKTDIEEILPSKLYGDDVRLKQIIMNLLTNAVKYTDRGSVTLKIHYRNVDEQHVRLLVAVSDTGKGIKPEDMEALFSPYARVEESKNRKIEGTGLGMSIVKTLLTLMDSELKVESIYGEGSTFSFEVLQEVRDRTPMGSYEKIMTDEAEVAKATARQIVAPEARILTVDDTIVNLVVLKELLKKTQIKIDTATSGAEALQKVAREKYDLIFMDHMMPGMDGIECLQCMRSTGTVSKDIPIIVLTANVVAGYREMFMDAGFTDFLAKPVDVRELDKMLVQYLPRDKMTQL